MRTRERAVIALVAVLAVAGCTSGESDDVVTGAGAAVPAPTDMLLRGAASFRGGLALYMSPKEDPQAQRMLLRSASGEFTELPAPPTGGAFRVGSAGDSLLLGGVACADGDSCDQGRVTIFRLAADGDSWTTITEGPEMSSEVEQSVTPGTSRFAWFAVGNESYLVSPSGTVVEEVPPLDALDGSDTAFSCVLADRQVVIPAGSRPAEGVTGIDPIAESSGEVWELRLDRPDRGWAAVAATPFALSNLGGTTECGSATMTIHGADGAALTYDAATRSWTESPSNWGELTGSAVFAARQPGEIASLPDGSATFAVQSSQLFVRRGIDTWEATGMPASAVYVADGDPVVVHQGPDGLTFESFGS